MLIYNKIHKQLTVIMGDVKRPHEKNSKKITTKTWKTEGLAIFSLFRYKQRQQRRESSRLLPPLLLSGNSGEDLGEEAEKEVEILQQIDPKVDVTDRLGDKTIISSICQKDKRATGDDGHVFRSWFYFQSSHP